MDNQEKSMASVVRQRVASKIRHGAQRVKNTLVRLGDEALISKDYLVGVGHGRENIKFVSNGTINMLLMAPGEPDFVTPPTSLTLHDNAIRQFGEKFNIPVAYIRRLASGSEQERALAQRILTDHTAWARQQKLLVRCVGEQARGVLSDKYRRLDSFVILKAFIEQVQETGAVLCDAHFTDTRLYVEALYPEPIVFPTPKNGDVGIAFGTRLSSSDYGDGALDLRFYMMQGVCLNGMVRESVMRQVHLGKKLPSDLNLSEDTYRLDTETTASAIRDLTNIIMQPENIRSKMEEIQNASNVSVDLAREVTALQKSGRLFKEEAAGVTELLMQGRAEDGISGEATMWKLIQGVSAYSRDIDPARSRELQEVAGELFDRVKQN